MCDGALLSRRRLNTFVLMGSSKWTLCFAFLVCMASALPIKLSLSQPTGFLTFTFLILFTHPTVGEWASICVFLHCWLGLTHNIHFREYSFMQRLFPPFPFLLTYRQCLPLYLGQIQLLITTFCIQKLPIALSWIKHHFSMILCYSKSHNLLLTSWCVPLKNWLECCDKWDEH